MFLFLFIYDEIDFNRFNKFLKRVMSYKYKETAERLSIYLNEKSKKAGEIESYENEMLINEKSKE